MFILMILSCIILFLKYQEINYISKREKDNGSGYISMYVETDSTSEVFAYLTFFVYNKKVNTNTSVSKVCFQLPTALPSFYNI